MGLLTTEPYRVPYRVNGSKSFLKLGHKLLFQIHFQISKTILFGSRTNSPASNGEKLFQSGKIAVLGLSGKFTT